MLSKQGMFDQIQILRKETGRIYDLIGHRFTHTLWHLYTRCKTHKEFRQKAKNLLGW